jgi:hypothetical protein
MNLGTIKLHAHCAGVALGPLLPLKSDESETAWRNMCADMLISIFSNRTAYLITIDPQSWSLLREFSDEPVKEIDAHKYLLVHEHQCSILLLQSVSESEDFRRGLLLLLSEFTNHLTSTLTTILKSNTISSLPASSKDVLLCVADGTVLWWINPSHTTAELTRMIADLSHSYGFDFAIERQTDLPAEDSC